MKQKGIIWIRVNKTKQTNIEKINAITQIWFFEKINKLIKLYPAFTRGEKRHIYQHEEYKGDITTDSIVGNNESIMKKLYVNKLDKLDKIDKFLKGYNLLKLNKKAKP